MSKLNLRDLYDKHQENAFRIREIAEACEKEERERTEAETAEYQILCRENDIIEMKLKAAASDQMRDNPNTRAEVETLIRESIANKKVVELLFVRETMLVSDVEKGGIIPLNVQDILQPLEEGFILNKVGLPMPAGLHGDFVWPVYETIEATVAGEAEEIAPSKIELDALKASPSRVSVAAEATAQTATQTDGLLEMIIRKMLPKAILNLLNRVVFSGKAVNPTAERREFFGPFALPAVREKMVALTRVPSFDDLNQMKATILESGIEGDHLCWVMTKSMAAKLEGVPINEKGIHVPMLQDGRLCGLPVHTTNAVANIEIKYKKYKNSAWADHEFKPKSENVTYTAMANTEDEALAKIQTPTEGKIAKILVRTEYIGIGDFAYQPMGFFGSFRFTVDPYTKALEDIVRFILNADFATKTLRPEAFLLGKVATA